MVRPPDRNCPVGQSLQPVSLEALGVLLTNVPASHALCAVQDVAVVVAPARHWPERHHVIAGLDEEAGGTWLALGDDGVVAAILNRYGSLGPAPGKRSRGELPLEAVDYSEARVAASALSRDCFIWSTNLCTTSATNFWASTRTSGRMRCFI